MVLCAFILDRIVGDPRWLPHPVVTIGWMIARLESLLRRWVAPLIGLKSSGVLLMVLMVGTVYFITSQVLVFASLLQAWLGWVLAVWLLASTIAAKSLYLAAHEIYGLLKAGNITEARIKVGWIVGRDTDQLEPPEIMRATVETVAENIVDGVISPLFYGFIGGVPLAMAYRVVNTLDSMVGYKNEKYLEFGWASARLDDLANYIPARITALLILLIAALLGYKWQAGWHTIRKDANIPVPTVDIQKQRQLGC